MSAIARLDSMSDVIIIVEVFSKKTVRTPKRIVDLCQNRLREYDNA